MVNYKRDKRSPQPRNEFVSKVMSANKARDTKPELAFRHALFHSGLKGYRLNYRKIPGRPDIVFVSKKVAIFIHGCFWHRCPTCNLSLPKHNTEFWLNKFSRNVERDKRKMHEVLSLGWKVVIVWECELKKNIDRKVREIAEQLKR